MSNIVWNAENGWHDGPEVKVGLDQRGRICFTPTDERAKRLGMVHGYHAAQNVDAPLLTVDLQMQGSRAAADMFPRDAKANHAYFTGWLIGLDLFTEEEGE